MDGKLNQIYEGQTSTNTTEDKLRRTNIMEDTLRQVNGERNETDKVNLSTVWRTNLDEQI